MLKQIALSLAALAAVSATSVAAAQEEYTVQQAMSDPENWRKIDPEDLVVMSTTKGDIYIEIAPGFAPRHAEQIRRIVRSGLYSGTQFHRVIRGFMAQGGDIAKVLGREPNFEKLPGEFTFRRNVKTAALTPLDPEKSGAAEYSGYFKGFPVVTKQDAQADFTIDGRVESYMPHCPGVVSMARTNDPNSAVDQFFLMRETSDFLDKSYTSWGRMVKGLEVARSLNVGEPPPRPDILVSATMGADYASRERPEIWVMRTDGPAFAQILKLAGEVDEICDAPIPPAVIKNQKHKPWDT